VDGVRQLRVRLLLFLLSLPLLYRVRKPSTVEVAS
jgi:hypothetical protein